MRKIIVASAVALISMAGIAHAGPLAQGQFAGSIQAGQEYAVDGDVHGGATAPVASLAALNPNLPAANAELRIGSRSYDDIYGELTSFEIEGAFGLGSNREVFVTLRRVQGDEGTVQVGTAFVPALNASLPVNGTFGEFNARSFEGGVRQYFGESALKPYVAGRLGVTAVDKINATFVVPVPTGVGAEPNDIVLRDVPFYDDSTTFTVGFDLGVSWDLTERFSLAAETGLRYSGELNGDDSAIGGLGLGSINDDGKRISAPITLKARYAF